MNRTSACVGLQREALEHCLQQQPVHVAAGIEDMRVRREEVQRQIQDEEVEKGKIQQDLAVLTKRLTIAWPARQAPMFLDLNLGSLA